MESPLIWYRNGKGTPMVPCDDAAVERAIEALRAAWRAERGALPADEVVAVVLQAAGEAS